MKTVVDDVFEITGRDPLLDVAVELERIARSDDFFIKRKLYPNVDFYSGTRFWSPLPPKEPSDISIKNLSESCLNRSQALVLHDTLVPAGQPGPILPQTMSLRQPPWYCVRQW